MSFQVGRGGLPLIITRQRLSDTPRHLSVQLGPSLAIHEKALGPNHTDVGASLNDLAGLYLSQGRYTEAEPLFKRALAICENALGSDQPELGMSLNYLAGLYLSQGRPGSHAAGLASQERPCRHHDTRL